MNIVFALVRALRAREVALCIITAGRLAEDRIKARAVQVSLHHYDFHGVT